MINPSDFFCFDDFTPTLKELFQQSKYVWECVAAIPHAVAILLEEQEGPDVCGHVSSGAHFNTASCYLGEGAVVEAGAFVKGPAYIGEGVVIRHGAYIRENVVLLPNSLVGHSSEVKNSFLFPQAAAPHFNYVGDSILGHNVNLGAGTKTGNVEMSPTAIRGTKTIVIDIGGERYATGMSKLGTIMGDGAECGCNCVLNPGTLVGRGTIIYGSTNLKKGLYTEKSIIKLHQHTEIVRIKTI